MVLKDMLITMLIRIVKKSRVILQSELRRSIMISSGIIAITAIIAFSVTGLFNYTPDTSLFFPYISPPLGEEQSYYWESTVDNLWNTFFSPYGDMELARVTYLSQSYIFKDILIRDYILDRIFENYFIFNSIKFIPINSSELYKLKIGDMIDIIGFCASLDEGNDYIIVVNCQFFPAGFVPLPLPGGPAPISGGY